MADFIDVGVGEVLSFWDITCLVRMSREIAIGYIPDAPAHDDEGLARAPSVSSGVSGSRRGASRIVLNPPDKAAPREWHPQDRIIVVGMCRQAKAKAEMAEAQRAAETAVHSRFMAGSGRGLEEWGQTLEHHGWLRTLRPGREEEMEDEGSWEDRLCFVTGGELVHAVGDGGRARTRPLCALAAIRGIQSLFWPPGYNTFRVELEGGTTLTFSAVSVEDCREWIAVLQVRTGRWRCTQCTVSIYQALGLAVHSVFTRHWQPGVLAARERQRVY